MLAPCQLINKILQDKDFDKVGLINQKHPIRSRSRGQEQ